MPAVSSILKIARYPGGIWASVAVLTFAAQVLQTRRCATGYFGPEVQAAYEQVLTSNGPRRVYAYDAWLCLTRPWTAVARLVREDQWARDRAGDKPGPVREYVPRPSRP